MQKKFETRRESFDKAFNDKTSFKFYKVHHTKVVQKGDMESSDIGMTYIRPCKHNVLTICKFFNS